MLDVPLLGLSLRTQLREVVLALLEVAGVVADVSHQALVLERRHVAHASVHERAVVAHEKDRAVVACDELLKPADALEVEVVRGLIEKEKVGMTQQQLREGDAHLPAA